MNEEYDRKLRRICLEFCDKKYQDREKGERLFNAICTAREMVEKYRNELILDPIAGQPIGDVTTSYTDVTSISAIHKIVDWCRSVGRHEFASSEIKHLMDHNQYANLNHLDRFAGIIYRPLNPKTGRPFKGKFYGINLGRADEFFSNKRPGPVQIVTNRLTGERVAVTEKLLRDFPGIEAFIDGDGNYCPQTVIDDSNSIKKKLPTVPELIGEKSV